MQVSPLPLAESVPPDVYSWASELGVLDAVELVTGVTTEVFSGEALDVRVEEDPEILNDKHFVFHTTAHGDVDTLVGLHDLWHRRLPELSGVRPGLFRLSIDARE